MVTPIKNGPSALFKGNSDVGAFAPKKVGVSGVNSETLEAVSPNPNAEYIERWQKEKAELQQKLNDLIDQKDKLKEEYANASFFGRIGLGAQLGVKALEIMVTAAQIERLTAKIKEYS